MSQKTNILFSPLCTSQAARCLIKASQNNEKRCKCAERSLIFEPDLFEICNFWESANSCFVFLLAIFYVSKAIFF